MALTVLAARFGRSHSWAKQVVHEHGDYQPRQSDRARALDALRQQLADGTYAPGERLASSDVLAGRFGVHRGTVDWALSQLAARGLIERSGGSRANGYRAPALPVLAGVA
jgi:DNA-binding GntR family transcriptional regulator